MDDSSATLRMLFVFVKSADSTKTVVKSAKYRSRLAADILHGSAVIVRQRITVLGLVT